jgi:hypothetical protein
MAMLFEMAGIGSAQGQLAERQQLLTNPGQNEAERWVWNEVQGGREANLHRHCNADLDPRARDDSRWRDPCRAISAAFIEQVLTQDPWRSRLPFRGLHIGGAEVSEPLDLAAAHVSAEIGLYSSRFEREVRFARARFDNLLSLNGSTFESGIIADGLRVGGALHLREGAAVRGGPFRLLGAKIEGNLDMIGSTFENGIIADGLEVGGDLLLRAADVRGTFKSGLTTDGQEGALLLRKGAVVRGDPLVLRRAKITRNVDMDGSTFESGIIADGLQVGGGLFLREGAVVRGGPLMLLGAKIEGPLEMTASTFESGIIADGLQVNSGLFLGPRAVVRNGPVVLARGKIEGPLEMIGSMFESELVAYSLQVKGDLILVDATFKQTPEIIFARIDGRLDISKTELPGLDLSGTTVGELRLGSGQSAPPNWIAAASLLLRGTHTKVLLDRLDTSEPCPDRDAWPRRLDLQGFVYEQLGTDRGPGTDMREREACWYRSWLERDPHFAPQPYRQLASVLRTAGDPERADAVLYAARDRERTEAWTRGGCGHPFKDWPWRRSECWRAAGLGLLKVLIGYGIGSGLFIVFYWVFAFTLLGMLVLLFSPSARAKGKAWMFGASLDQLLPIVSLNKEFENFFNDPWRLRLKGWQLGYFAFHALFGFLLGSFVVAALAGLTQTG